MTFATSLLLLSCLVPVPQGLKLPPREPKPSVQSPVQRPDNELERFRRDLSEVAGSPARSEEKLQEMGLAYPAIDQLIVETARRARAKEMTDLMVVARRFGTAAVAQELRYQLLSRPLGAATRPVVDTMVYLMGAERDPQNELDERKALQDCIRGRVASAQRPATEALCAMAGEQDLEFGLALAGEQNLDLQLRGVDVLAAVRTDRARARLVELLSKEPALAAGACDALIGLGAAAAPELTQVLEAPPIDRSYAYAAFALAQIGDAGGKSLLPPAAMVVLRRQLAAREPLLRTLAAIPSADLAYFAAPDATDIDDKQIAEALLDVVDGTMFVPNLDLLRRPAEQRLVRMTGRVDAAQKTLSWRQWWALQKESFVGMRANLAVDVQSAAVAMVTLRGERQRVRLLAEGLADQAPMADTQEVLLTAEQMLELVQRLEQGGFGDREAMRRDPTLPVTRSIEVQVRGARSQVAMPAVENAAFAGLVQTIDDAVGAQLWQLYRNPKDEPDRAAFWRTERRWLDANPDPTARGQRFVHRVLANWDGLGTWQRAKALEHLFQRADRAELFDEAAGDRVLALVRACREPGEIEIHLLELAARVPGDRVWRECVDAAASTGAVAQQAVRAVFAVLGPERVLAALADSRPLVRKVAIAEVVVTRDPRAAPTLVAMVADTAEDAEVRRAAVHATGQLRLAAGYDALVAAIVAEDTVPDVRRECLRALGRVGGAGAFALLDRAVHTPSPEDREAALRGLGELDDPRAAKLLAELLVDNFGRDVGMLARHYLGRIGAGLAVPALRAQVETLRDDVTRNDLILLLGGYQDPQMVPELVKMLRVPSLQGEATAALTVTTGVDVGAADDPYGAMDAWWRGHRAEPQWRWLLDALTAANVPTVLRDEHFAPGAGAEAVPELARLLSELDEPRLFVLTNAVLRTVAKADLGIVDVRTPQEERAGIAARYRVAFETQQALNGR